MSEFATPAAPLAPAAFPAASALAGLFLLVFGVRLVAIAAYGSALPFMDEWDAGAGALYSPYLTGSFGPLTLFARVNEHITFTSQLLNLLLLELAGEWNPLLQMTANGALYAGFAAAFTGLVLDLVPRPHRLAFIALAALLFGLPFDTEVVLMGMNAHFYFVAIFSMAALRLWTAAPAFSVRWLLGLAMAALGFLSMASGALTPFVGAIAVLLQAARGGRSRGAAEWVGPLVLFGLGAVMVWSVPDLPHHDRLKAHDILQYLDAAVAILSLPLLTIAGVIVVHLPILVFGIATLHRGREAPAGAWFVLAAAGWSVAQMLLVAYGRSTDVLNSRYLVPVPFLLLLDGLAVLALLPRAGLLRRAAAAWYVVVAFAALAAANIATWRAMDRHHERLERQQAHVSAYLATSDLAAFTADPAGIPYPTGDGLARYLDRPEIRAILPQALRPPDADRAIVASRTLLGGSTAAPMLAALDVLLRWGAAILALGGALLLLSVLLEGARRRDS